MVQIDNMGLQKPKLKYDVHSGIGINNYLPTTAGDWRTRYQFTHMADSMHYFLDV